VRFDQGGFALLGSCAPLILFIDIRHATIDFPGRLFSVPFQGHRNLDELRLPFPLQRNGAQLPLIP
jgi:hypothetical protein